MGDWMELVKGGCSSDPFPAESIVSESDYGLEEDPILGGGGGGGGEKGGERGRGKGKGKGKGRNVMEMRGRETAVLDRFIAIKVGEDLRRAESCLSESGEGLRDVLTRLQVGLSLSLTLITPRLQPNRNRDPPFQWPPTTATKRSSTLCVVISDTRSKGTVWFFAALGTPISYHLAQHLSPITSCSSICLQILHASA